MDGNRVNFHSGYCPFPEFSSLNLHSLIQTRGRLLFFFKVIQKCNFEIVTLVTCVALSRQSALVQGWRLPLNCLTSLQGGEKQRLKISDWLLKKVTMARLAGGIVYCPLNGTLPRVLGQEMDS